MEFSVQVDLYHHCMVLQSCRKSLTLKTSEWKLGHMDTNGGDIEVVLIGACELFFF